MISEEQVRHVANLARLGLTDDEIVKMGGQLDAILDSIEKIQELDLADVPPTANPLDLSNVLRSDEPGPEFSQERHGLGDYLASAAAKDVAAAQGLDVDLREQLSANQ